jgi:V/A-type H+/Na+-transporting ATPase subunit E
MTGIEKIIVKIEDDCTINCEDIIAEGQEKARMILSDAQAAAEKSKEEIIEAAKKRFRMDIDLAYSRAENEHKKAILAARINIINEIINEAMIKLNNMPDAEYLNVVKELILKFAENGHGSLCFSKKDLTRIPQYFEANLNKMFDSSGKSVEISKIPADIDGGFIISYDDIEQNCTFESLLNSSLNEIKDRLYNELFMKDNI